MTEKVMIKKEISGNEFYVEAEKHSPHEMPRYYPSRLIKIGENTLGLLDCHSEHFVPTSKAQADLKEKIKAFQSWCYVYTRSKERVRD